MHHAVFQGGFHVNSAPKIKTVSFISAPRSGVKPAIFTKAAPTLKSLYWGSLQENFEFSYSEIIQN